MFRKSTIPFSLKKTILSTFGKEGFQWLENFDSNLEFFLDKWQIENLQLFPNLTYNFVAYGKAKNIDIVLKAGPPNQEFSDSLITQLNFPKIITVPIIDYDLEKGFILMERAKPGVSLKASPSDNLSTQIAIKLMSKIWQSSTNKYPYKSIIDWSNALTRYQKKYNQTGPLNPKHIQKAIQIFRSLSHQSPWKLLHGDLHHDNIISHQNKYLVIDPKGILGPPIYELGAWFRNFPIHTPISHFEKLTETRLFQFEKSFNFPHQDILQWSFTQSVLSACWTLEEKQNISKETNSLINLFDFKLKVQS